MNFHKVDTPANFAFDLAPALSVERLGGCAFRLRAQDRRWSGNAVPSLAGLEPAALQDCGGLARLEPLPGGGLRLSWAERTILESEPGRGLGVNGQKWIHCFRHEPDRLHFGMGEKNLGFERSGKRSLFWNTDAFADFHWGAINEASYDPAYASLPVLIVTRAGLWAAIVVDSPWPAFMNTGAQEGIFQAGATTFQPELSFGARGGAPDFYLLAEADPLRLVQAIQRLQGRMPLPPLWALGHQQCRWGYASCADLSRIADEYEARGIPNDGLWLDIDYMEGYRVFSVKETQRESLGAELAALRQRGHPVVPILDPGIRRDPEYPVYRRAAEADILCRSPEGREFIGYVWPGYTVFPDFSLAEGRDFWAREVAEFTCLGFSAYWIDMNDPSTGTVPVEDMLFGRGSLPHEAGHNQYAIGMAMATRAGLEAARPGLRQFLVSRSGSLGLGRHAALWTGDNLSNEAHLASAIPVSLNLSVSGLPFNGPDVPGFAGDADAALARAWYKLGFLFPFFRNHSVAGSREQEPWRFGRASESVIAGMIKSRYRLMPWLYNLFMDQEAEGLPILRPLWLHDDSTEALAAADQFMVGADILQAPLTDRKSRTRPVWLPPGLWYGLIEGRLLSGGRWRHVRQGYRSTPLYLRAGSIIPLRRGDVSKARADYAAVDLLVIPDGAGQALGRYRFDDGESLAYRDGRRSDYRLSAECLAGSLDLRVEGLSQAAGQLDCRVLLLPGTAARRIRLNGKNLQCRADSLELAGSRLRLLGSEPVRP